MITMGITTAPANNSVQVSNSELSGMTWAHPYAFMFLFNPNDVIGKS
jgi:hypothetical protein